MIILCFWIIITVCAQAPGMKPELYLLTTIFPLNFGLSRIFHISYEMSSIFFIPALFSSALGYLFILTRQLSSMARSGLFPAVFYTVYGKTETPIVAMLTGSALSLIGLFCAWKYNPYTMLFRLSILGGCPVYIAMFYCFHIFRTRYEYLPREFVNPLGYPSAIVGSLIFLLLFISMIQNRDQTQIMTSYFVFMAGMFIYYYLYAESRQFFSPKEQHVFLRAYVMNCKLQIIFDIMLFNTTTTSIQLISSSSSSCSYS
jgi:amino acid transporter